MLCPACKVEMIVVEFDGIELDFCVDCKGTWFDAEELEELLTRAGVDPSAFEYSVTIDGSGTVVEKPRRCPRCKKIMRKAKVAGANPVIIDKCANHGGLWFDGGELQTALSGTLDNDGWKKASDFIGGILAYELIQMEG